jgi:nucleotide-binding universal stress UspA family protein
VDPLDWHIHKAEAKAYLGEVSTRLQETRVQVESVLLEGQPAERIIEFAHAQGVGLILLSSHGRSGLSGWNISSVVQKIILRAYMPTMVVRAYQHVTNDLEGLRYRRLLAPLDGSQRAECVLPLATTLARFYSAKLLLAHVVSRPEIPRRVLPLQDDVELADRLTERNRIEADRYLAQLRSRLSSDVRIHLLVGVCPAAVLHELVVEEEVDLVLLSAHGYSGNTRWPYGSVALNFIAYGTTPLLIMQDLSQDEVVGTRAELAAREYKGH